MEKISFKKLAESKKKFEGLLVGFNLKLESSSWLYKAYSIVEKISDIYSNDIARKKFIKTHGDAKIFFSLYDVHFLHDSLPFIKNQNSKILKLKLKKILKMTSPDFENCDNNESRNIFWEVYFCSLLNKSGIAAVLKDPNPDIFISFNNSQEYFIECKRIYSHKKNAIQNNINKAIEQFKKNPLSKEKNSFLIIALSLENCLLPRLSDNNFELSESGDDAMNKLKKILEPVVIEQINLIRNDSQIAGMFLYAKNIFIIGKEKVFSPVSFFSIIDNSKNRELSRDFKNLISLKDN